MHPTVACRSSYSSQFSCLTLSQARVCSSSLVQGLSSCSSLRRSYSSTRSKTKVSLVRGFTTRGGVDSGSSKACTCCSVSSITAASLPSSYRIGITRSTRSKSARLLSQVSASGCCRVRVQPLPSNHKAHLHRPHRCAEHGENLHAAGLRCSDSFCGRRPLAREWSVHDE